MTLSDWSSKSAEAQLDELLGEDTASILDREATTFDKLAGPLKESLVLFGAGNLGRKTLAGLRQLGQEPRAFADNNPLLWNTTVEGIPVLSPEEAARQFGQTAAFVLTVTRARQGEQQADRRRQLLQLNCRTVIPFGYLFWKHPDLFLPHFYLVAPHEVIQHADELRRLFYLWADEASRREFLAHLRFRLHLDYDGLPFPYKDQQYFPAELYPLLPNEVFVDCGAYDGDSLRKFVERQGPAFGQFVAFEPDPANFSKLQAYVDSLPQAIREKVVVRQAAVGACGSAKVHFAATGGVDARVADSGELEIDCLCLDEALANDTPTLIKMDIEGFELEALAGSRQVIARAHPILAICAYHLPNHLWQVPLYLSNLSDNYRLFLRPHDEEGLTVCYAVPSARLTKDMRE
jgi:FkbM family methyltransferase